jgi:hypothetical protein
MLWAPTAPAQLGEAGTGALDRAGLPDAASWWALPGRAPWQPESDAGLAFPGSYAGLVRGGWRLDEPERAPAVMPWPGVAQARTPLAWYDSLACARPGGGDGWDGALDGAVGQPIAGAQRARSAFSLGSGASALDETALTLARSDSLRGFGLDAMSGTRGAGGGLARLGRHAWGTRVRFARGAHRFAGAVGQRGAAAKLEGGEEQATRGQSGSVDWSWERGGRRWGAGFARGLDRHESFGGGLPYSERAALETRLSAGAGLVRGGREAEARLTWSQAEVRRAGARAFSRQAGSLWASAGGAASVAGGRLELAFGAGRHGGVDRFDVAPSARFTRALGGVAAELSVERVLTPVWADLAPGTEPFLQRAWVGGAGLAAGAAGSWRARAGVRGGRVYSRALLDRLPIEELWLRNGISAEYGTYDFALAEGGIEHAGRRLDAGLEGHGLAHRSTATPAGAARAIRYEPDAGFRAWLGGRARFFRGDLGLGLRGEAAGVGAREGGTSVPRPLPAYVTLSLLGEVSLGDVVVVWRLRNLEDRARDASWTDRATGLPAVEGKRELQMRLVWRLFN